MNVQRQMRTDHRLWFVLSTIAFVSFGFVSLVDKWTEYKAGPSYLWGVVMTVPRYAEPGAAVLVILWYTLIAAVPAVAFGWVAQAIVVTVRTAFATDRQHSSSTQQ